MAARVRVKAIDFKAGKPTRWQAYDVIGFEVADASKRKMTREGFLVVPAFISRAGNVQDYTARELGIEGTNRAIRLYRPPEEVFKPESVATFERQVLTNSHPDGDVSAANYRQVTSGDVHDVAPAEDGINLGANLYVKDASTIEMVVTYDKNQLSCGYSFVLDMTEGTTPEGEKFDGVMRDIIGNHVAIVWQARGGPGLRVADKKPNQEKRIMRTVTIDGTNVNFEDDNQGAMVEVALKRAADAVKTATDATTAATAQMTASAAALKAATDASAKATADHAVEIAKLQAQVVTDEQKAAMVAELVKTIADAKTILGDKYDAGTKGAVAIRLDALEAVVKDAAAYPGVVAVFGGKKPAELTEQIAAIAFDAAVAVRAAGGATVSPGTRTADGDYERQLRDAIAGKGNGGAKGTPRVIDYNARNAPKSGQASA